MPLQQSTGGSTGFSRALRIPSFLWGSRSSSIGARGAGPSHSTTLPCPGELLLLPAPLLQCPASSLLLLRPLPLPQRARREGASHRREELRSTRRCSSFALHAACLLVSSVTGSSGRPDLESRSAAVGEHGRLQAGPAPPPPLQRVVVLLLHTSASSTGEETAGSTARWGSPQPPLLSYGPPWAHYLGGYQDRLLGGPWDYPACATRHLKAWSTRTIQE
jgi:hypothetical protein